MKKLGRYELVDSKAGVTGSSKFYEVTFNVPSKTFSVHWGKIDGKRMSAHGYLAREVTKKISEKLRKGYRFVGPAMECRIEFPDHVVKDAIKKVS